MEAQPDSFLSLPAHYGTSVSDLVHFSLDGTSDSLMRDITTGPGTLLVSKIIDGLRACGGYEAADIAKVAGLVERNVYSAHSSQVRGEIERTTTANSGADDKGEAAEGQLWDIPRLTVELLFRGLLDADVGRDRAVHVNSNEPVLMINLDGGGDGDRNGRMSAKERDTLNYVTNIAVTAVQHVRNIWPVRVYAGRFLQTVKEGASEGGTEEAEEYAIPSFSITLLNVVNTDIGGPGMPQLLDTPCAASEWSRVLRKEVWRGRDLVSREENAELFEQHTADDASERSFGSADDDDESVGSDALRALDLEDEAPRGREARETEADDGEDGDDQWEGSSIDDTRRHEIPSPGQFVDLARADDAEDAGHERDVPEAETHEEPIPQEVELPIRHISHPSWDHHDDRTSLLDLIISQASRIAPFGTESAGDGVADVEGNVAGPAHVKAESEENVEEGEAAASEAKPAQAKSSSEDEFVVV